MSEQSWLNEQAQALRLLDTEVAALHAAGFELREDFDGATAERLERVGLRPAAANRVLKAAGVLGSPAPRAVFDQDARAAIEAGSFEIEDVVNVGSPRACERLGMHEEMSCARCGARLSIVYVTSSGPLGGDCLATLTGDPSSRSRMRNLSRKLHNIAIEQDARFRLEAAHVDPADYRGLKQVSVVRLYPSGYERCVYVHNGPQAEVVMIVERIAGQLGYAPGVWPQEDGTTIVNVRHTVML